ncbi:MAG: YchF family ATPase [Patescibacteria group bacterium]|nr:YchF family ATPase [Patescibacteria group bacterium]MCL5432161.1 YchF family ATPase [Patescibacteria group bacterium]
MLQVGIVGLPNVGKSTLFNALLRRQQALVANYPFATIDPNVGIVPVPDGRLDKLAAIYNSPIVPATVQFVDIAGLVKGASTGAGLGNKFLSHIREVDLICEVVRAFPDDDVIREGSSEPKSDIDVINTELILADLQTIENQKAKLKIQNSELEQRLNRGEMAGEAGKPLQLLTAKKIIYVLNVNTTSQWAGLQEIVNNLRNNGKDAVVIDAKLEAELGVLTADEREEYLESLGVKDSGVDQLISTTYASLNLISFLTAGVKEVRAWTIARGTKAPAAAGVIHTDFEKNFIKAEVVNYVDFVSQGGWKNCRDQGKTRLEGKDYEMQDGDVVEFKVGT